MKITLLGHSGFLVEGQEACLVFDYFTDELGLLDRIDLKGRKLIFFASHAHRDHFNKRIFDYAGRGAVAYVLGQGISAGGRRDAVVLGKGQRTEPLGIPVRAYGSTDEGVSFLTWLDGRKIFHAGDLNDWYWEEESTREELAHDEQWFFDEAAPLSGEAPDVAFVPVDARLGRHALRGALHFARTMKPRRIVPMHLSGGYNLPGELMGALKEEAIQTEVALIARPGDSIEI